MRLLHIPFAKGADESADPMVLPEGYLTSARNVRILKEGRIGQRAAAREIALDTVGGGSIGGACSFIAHAAGANIIGAGGTVYAYTPDGFVDPPAEAGSIPMMVPVDEWDMQAPRFEGDASRATVACANDYMIVAYEATSTVAGSSVTNTWIRSVHREQRALVEEVEEPSTAGDPKCIKVGDSLLCFYFLSSSTASLRVRSVNTATNGSISSASTISGTFDDLVVAPYTDTLYVMSYRSGSDIITETRDAATHTVQNTHTVAVGTLVVAISAHTEGDGATPANDRIWVGYTKEATGEVRVQTYTGALSSVANNSVATTSGTESFRDCWVGPDVTAGQAVLMWLVDDSTATNSDYMRAQRITSAGATTGSPVDGLQMAPVSKPVVADGKVLVWVAPDTDALLQPLLLVDVDLASDVHGIITGRARLGANDRNQNAVAEVETGSWLYVQSQIVRSDSSSGNYQTQVPVYEYRTPEHSFQAGARRPVSVGHVAMLPGGSLMQWDGEGLREEQEPVPPVILSLTSSAGSGSLTNSGTYIYSLVLERTDAAGRVLRSAPSAPQTVTLGASDDTVTVVVRGVFPLRGQWVAKLYRTTDGGSLLYRTTELTTGDFAYNNASIVDTTSDSDLAEREVLYAGGALGKGEVESDPAPASTFGVVALNRLWLGGLFRNRRIRCSTEIESGSGLRFPELANYWIDLPDRVTGLAEMAGNLVVFTEREVYVLGAGDNVGPDFAGNGVFPGLRKIASDSGCIDWRSVVPTSVGVFYQSGNGIMLLPVGFGPPVYVGRAVQDSIERDPYVASAQLVEDGNGGTVRFALVGDDTATGYFGNPTEEGRVLVYSLRSQAWTHDTYNQGPVGQLGMWRWGGKLRCLMGRQDLSTNPFGGSWSEALLLEDSTISFASQSTPPTGGEEDFLDFSLDTGELHPGGLLNECRFSRVYVRGIYRGECLLSVTSAVSAGGNTSGTTDSFELDSAEYTPGQAFRFESRLRGQVGESIALTIAASSRNNVYLTNGVQLTGVTIEWEPRRPPKSAAGSRA